MPEQPPQKANFLEIIGAWLGVWTPPRDVEIPPVPWRALAIGAVGVLAVLGVALAVFVPRIAASKDEADARAAAEKRANVEANRVRITKAQAPHHGEARALRAAGDREALMARVKADLLTDARARTRAGDMKPVTGEPNCVRTPGTPTAGAKRWFDCFLPTVKIKATERSPEGALGYPFRAVVDYGAFTYTWCKIEQVPGEMLVLLPEEVTILPPECRAPRS